MHKRFTYFFYIILMVTSLPMMIGCDEDTEEPSNNQTKQEPTEPISEDIVLLAAIPSKDFVLLVREIELEKTSVALYGSVGLIPLTNEGQILGEEQSCKINGSYGIVSVNDKMIAIVASLTGGIKKELVIFDSTKNIFHRFEAEGPFIGSVVLFGNRLYYSTEHPEVAIVMVEIESGDTYKFATERQGLLSADFVILEGEVYARDAVTGDCFLITQEGIQSTTIKASRDQEEQRFDLKDFEDNKLEKYKEMLVAQGWEPTD